MMSKARMGWRRYAVRAGAVGVAALLLCWPAILNGYPLLFPDSIDYLGMGHGITMALRGVDTPAWMYMAKRSEIYAAGIFLLHGRGPLWPVVAMQALVTAWVVWLVVRSLCRRPVAAYVVLMSVLCGLTSVAWYASYIMPDILGPVLYLSLYVMIFAAETLLRWERWALSAVAWWALASHSTHLLLAVALCGAFTVLWLARRKGMRQRGAGLLWAGGIVLLAMAAQMAVHARLYGRASLFGNAPPFLMARLIGDGPARLYLQQNCATLRWTICAHVNGLPTNEEDFLWTDGGIWNVATPRERDQLRSEEMPLVLATLRTYPREQAASSFGNLLKQLTITGPTDFQNYSAFTWSNLEFSLRGLSEHYAGTRQARDRLPMPLYHAMQPFVIGGAALVCVVLLPWCWSVRNSRLLGLAATVLLAVPLNAMVCGVFSCVAVRYQDRLDWLLVLLAGVMLMAWLRRGEQLPVPAAG